MDPEAAVRKRYSGAAQEREAALCCPVDYDAKYLQAIPSEVIERDYGCGDPSKHLHEGETVLDLGSGTGKICFIAAQVVGPTGRVIGVDMTDDMLQIARNNAPVVAENIGFANVEFRKGRIQDLALDFERLAVELSGTPLQGAEGYVEADAVADQLRSQSPLIADDSIDVVVSNCVLNLVSSAAKRRMFTEVFRVLKPGGRAVISDIVSNKEVLAAMQADEELWSGCISGALREDLFVKAFSDAGFRPVQILERQAEPWRVEKEIDFRSITLQAVKPQPDNSQFFVSPAPVAAKQKCC